MFSKWLAVAVLSCQWLAVTGAIYANVFGVDHRVAVRDTRYPWRTIGAISTGGTGTLVGRNLVLTAAHVVLAQSGHVKPRIDFYPNQIGGRARMKAGVIRVWLGTTSPDKHRADDWAILLLDRNLGDLYGWMDISTEVPPVAIVAGYSEDFAKGTASADLHCRIRKAAGGLLLHDGATARGCSGGPIFKKQANSWYIVAVVAAERRGAGRKSLHLARYDERFTNFAIPTYRFAETLRRVRGG